MAHVPFIQRVQVRTARVAIGPSTARRMGPPGTVAAARTWLGNLNLAPFSPAGQDLDGFTAHLDRQTLNLQQALPATARRWGSSRKFLNIFLRDALYNQFLCAAYGLDRIYGYLEVPLDKNVGNGLRAEREGQHLPRWPGVTRLQPDVSAEYQAVARAIALRSQAKPVDLDLVYW